MIKNATKIGIYLINRTRGVLIIKKWRDAIACCPPAGTCPHSPLHPANSAPARPYKKSACPHKAQGSNEAVILMSRKIVTLSCFLKKLQFILYFPAKTIFSNKNLTMFAKRLQTNAIMLTHHNLYRETSLYTNDISEPPPADKGLLPDKLVGCNAERMKNIHENFLYVLENKKIYLDAHINLTKLSRLLCTNATYLSKMINTYFKCNLKTLLNQYRINHAKELLKKDNCNIQSLPAQCGFISRSTFYAAFTKFEHVTPTDYRAKHQSMEILKEIENNINRITTI